MSSKTTSLSLQAMCLVEFHYNPSQSNWLIFVREKDDALGKYSHVANFKVGIVVVRRLLNEIQTGAGTCSVKDVRGSRKVPAERDVLNLFPFINKYSGLFIAQMKIGHKHLQRSTFEGRRTSTCRTTMSARTQWEFPSHLG